MEIIINHIEYDYNAYNHIMQNIAEKYNFVSLNVIGKSVAGRDIKMLRIGQSKDYILYTAAIHGSERITATVLLRFIAELCECLKNGTKLADVDARRALTNKGVMFIPLCNPDGCEISLKGILGCGNSAGRIQKLCNKDFKHWKANLRGVDLNHNFDAGWNELHELERKNGYFGPSPTRYGGTHPESEPETAALTNLCRTNEIRHLCTFHSQGEVIYWDYKNIPTFRGKKMAEIFAASSQYSLAVPTGLAVGGGFKDWFIETFHRPGFTIEIGRGENPLPAQDGEKIYSQIKEMMMLGLLM